MTVSHYLINQSIDVSMTDPMLIDYILCNKMDLCQLTNNMNFGSGFMPLSLSTHSRSSILLIEYFISLLESCKKGLQARIGKCMGFLNDKWDLASTCKKLHPFDCPVGP